VHIHILPVSKIVLTTKDGVIHSTYIGTPVDKFLAKFSNPVIKDEIHRRMQVVALAKTLDLPDVAEAQYDLIKQLYDNQFPITPAAFAEAYAKAVLAASMSRSSKLMAQSLYAKAPSKESSSKHKMTTDPMVSVSSTFGPTLLLSTDPMDTTTAVAIVDPVKDAHFAGTAPDTFTGTTTPMDTTEAIEATTNVVVVMDDITSRADADAEAEDTDADADAAVPLNKTTDAVDE
jgi:hypothetical protein